MKGFNATIFAYGATGSGKTHTVIGSEQDPGIILRTVKGLLDYPGQFVDQPAPVTQVPEIQMSFLELYNNRAFDLLEPKATDISIRDDNGLQTHCPDLARVVIESNHQFSERFRLARNERITAPTRLNDQSSRSHAILILYIRYSDGTNIFRCATLSAIKLLSFFGRFFTLVSSSGKLNIIDLAGNEDNRKSGNCGSRMTESCQINSSLFHLSNVSRPCLEPRELHYKPPLPPPPSQNRWPLPSSVPSLRCLPVHLFSETRRTALSSTLERAVLRPLIVFPRCRACMASLSPLVSGHQRHQRREPARALPRQQAHPPPRRLPRIPPASPRPLPAALPP